MRSCLDVSKAQFSGQEKIHCLFLHVSFTFNSTFIKDLDVIFQGDRGPIGLPGAPGKEGMPGMKGAEGVVSLHLFFFINILHTQLYKYVHCTDYTDFFSSAREYNKKELKQFNSSNHFFTFCRELPGLEDLKGKMANLDQQVTRFVSSTVSSLIIFVDF